MKKIEVLKRSVVGVCAATLLTGLCVAPAFAKGVETGSETTIESGAEAGSTSVQAEADAVQISVTLPTSVTASVDSKGDLTFPDSASFTIKATNASWPVHVSKVDVAVASGYTLKDSSADVLAAKDLYLTLNGEKLSAGVNAGSAVTSMETQAGSATPMGVTMTGKMYNPSYTDVSSALSLVTLKWTVSA